MALSSIKREAGKELVEVPDASVAPQVGCCCCGGGGGGSVLGS